MKLKISSSGIKTIISLAALVVSIVALFVSFNTQREIQLIQYAPNINITSITMPGGSNVDYPCADGTTAKGKNERFYYNHEYPEELTLENQIKIQELSQPKFQELLQYADSIYFKDFNDENCIIVNQLKKDQPVYQNVKLDHANTIIQITNTGYPLTYFKLESLDIRYTDADKVATFYGHDENENTSFNKNLGTGESHEFYFDEIVYKGSSSICDLRSEVYRQIPTGVNLLNVKTIGSTTLKYKELKFHILAENQHQNKYHITISVTTNDNKISTKSIIDKMEKK